MRYTPENWTSVLDFSKVFGRDPGRLEIDLGSGKGRFLMARAAAHPETSFLGIDRQLLRIEKVERKSERLGLKNVRLIYVEADYAVRFMIPENSVAVYYIFFPDPWPKSRHHSRRLFNNSFIHALAQTMHEGGVVNIATDHLEYFREIKDVFSQNQSYTETTPFIPCEDEKTDFEILFSGAGSKIGRCSYQKKQSDFI